MFATEKQHSAMIHAATRLDQKLAKKDKHHSIYALGHYFAAIERIEADPEPLEVAVRKHTNDRLQAALLKAISAES